MGQVELYVESEGSASSMEQAIAHAIGQSPDIGFEEGAIITISVEATWADSDGTRHAKVSASKQIDPAVKARAERIRKEQAQLTQQGVPDVEVAHDNITRPDDDETEVFDLPHDMKQAEDEMEDDFAHAVHKIVGEPVNEAAPEPAPTDKETAKKRKDKKVTSYPVLQPDAVESKRTG